MYVICSLCPYPDRLFLPLFLFSISLRFSVQRAVSEERLGAVFLFFHFPRPLTASVFFFFFFSSSSFFIDLVLPFDIHQRKKIHQKFRRDLHETHTDLRFRCRTPPSIYRGELDEICLWKERGSYRLVFFAPFVPLSSVENHRDRLRRKRVTRFASVCSPVTHFTVTR